MELHIFLSVFPINYDVVIRAGSSVIFVGMIKDFFLSNFERRTYCKDFVKAVYMDNGNNRLIIVI